MPWTNSVVCSRVVSYPSQVISLYSDKKVVHVTLDSGATVSFITLLEATRLGFTVQKASQLANQADGETRLHVLGEVHEQYTRGAVKFAFNALVVKKLNDATVLAGMNFLIENEVSQEPHKHRVTVKEKYSIEETPAKFIYESDTPTSQTVNIKRISVLMPTATLEINVPNEYPPNCKFVVDSTDQANNDQTWLFQEVQAVNRSIKITNETSKPIILGKNQDSSIIKVRPVTSSPADDSMIKLKYKSTNSNVGEFEKSEDTLAYVQRINSNHRTIQPPPLDLYIPDHPDPEEYLSKIFIEQGVMNSDQHARLWSILRKYHKVFDNDISGGYNNASGEFDVDWDWLNDQQPPPGVSKQEVYANDEMNQLKQAKIDWMESQNICFKAHLLSVPVKYASLTMLVPKASFKDNKGPLHHGLFRFVNLFNQLNEFIKLEPSQPEAISSVLYEAGQWNHMISGDLSNSFYQRWITKRKLPYMAFHSPYKGMYILARSAQGMKNQSEGLDQWMRVVLGELIRQGKARKIADDVQAGGQTVDEAIANFEKVLIEFDKNNVKMDPKKTRIFAEKLPIFGWIKEGQFLKPDQHSILALEKAEKPRTITELRSYLGQYKVFYKHMPKMSTVLDPLQQLTGEKNGKLEIEWTEKLDSDFVKAGEAAKNIKPLYLPKRSDQLAITLDWSAKGIGATLWALLKDRKEVCCYFSSPLKGSQSKWPPCDGEGLATCAAIERFSNFIRESSLPTMICSDNKPVVQAAFLLLKGSFSTSPRLNKLLGNCNTFPIVFHHLSGKMALNEESDLLSRNPSSCDEVDCPVCKHLLEQSEILDTPMTGLSKLKLKFKHLKTEDTLIDKSPCNEECHTCNFLLGVEFDPNLPIKENLKKSSKVCKLQAEDILQGEIPFPFLGNRKVLIQVQKKDPVISKLIQNLQSGNRPNARNTKCNDLKTYLGFSPKLDYDGLVVVERVLQPHLINFSVPILPPNFAKSITLAAHIKLDHPKPAQFEKIIFRSFCALKVKNLIKELFDNCFTCQADLTIPKEVPNFKTESKPSCPGAYWSCDVMKHGRKNIMVSTDNFSSFTTCTFINSEKQADCENAIISSIFPFKAAAGDVKIRVDTAPGLSAMINHSSDDFKDAGIELEPGNPKNKNSLGKVDKTMAELRAIFRTVSPDGSPLSLLDLQKAVETLNKRIRNSNLSAREIMFSRLQDNNKNIKLDDEALSEAQYERRVKANDAAAKAKVNLKQTVVPDIKLHSLVFLKQDEAKDKSKVRDLYIVMDISDTSKELKIQKMLNPLTKSKSEISNRNQYTVRPTDIYLAPSQKKAPDNQHLESSTQDQTLPPLESRPNAKIPQANKSIKPNKFYILDDGTLDDDDIVSINIEVPRCESPIPTEDEVIDDSDDTLNEATIEEPDLMTFSPVIAQNDDNKSAGITELSPWSPTNTEQVVMSPIIQNLNDPDFGQIQLSWDHSSDLSTPMYNDSGNGEPFSDDASASAHNLAHSVAEQVLDGDDEEFDDDVFQDVQLFEDFPVQSDQAQVQRDPVAPLHLHLVGDNVQHGRVYRLESRLPVPLDLHMRENEVQPGKVYKMKRLQSDPKLKKTKQMKTKKKLPAVSWFIKKITFARKRPPDQDDDQPPGLAT